MKKAKTKDEMFMIRLYQEAVKQNNMNLVMDRYAVGLLAGLQQRGVNAICTLLLQANFLKKQGDTEVSLTPHGIKLVETLLNE